MYNTLFYFYIQRFYLHIRFRLLIIVLISHLFNGHRQITYSCKFTTYITRSAPGRFRHKRRLLAQLYRLLKDLTWLYLYIWFQVCNSIVISINCLTMYFNDDIFLNTSQVRQIDLKKSFVITSLRVGHLPRNFIY